MVTVEHADYHRNGVGGVGFHVGIVRGIEDDSESRFLVITFQGEDGSDSEYTAALNLDEAWAGNIYMHPHADQPGMNAWRGDRIAVQANAAILGEVTKRYAS